VKILSILSLIGLLLVGTALGQEKSEKANSAATPFKNRSEIPVTAEREAAVMDFVEQNHAELKELLTYLRDNRRKDYERAIRELSRDAERIGQVKDRDYMQYELELKAWTIKSRIQFLTAQMVMGNKDEIRGQLKTLLSDQLEVRLALMKRERERVQDRLARMEQEISRLEDDRQKILDNQLQVLTKSAADSKNKVKVVKNGSPKPAKKSAKPTVSQPNK
jgi:hypothetical protein